MARISDTDFDTDPATRISPTSPSSPTRQDGPPPTVADDEPAPKALGLSFTQVAGGALAAMTAAFLGSRFSLGGTVAGAAVASIVAAVGGAIYTTSIRRTRDKVRSVWTGDTRGVPTVVETSDRWSAEPTATRIDGVPTALPATPSPDGVRAAVSPRSPVALTESRPAKSPRPSRTRRIVVRALVGTVAIFGLAAVALTTVELLTGHALSGDQGTTISNVRPVESAPQPTQPTEASPSSTASPSAESSEAPSPAPTAAPTAEPSAEPTPSGEPSATPTPSTPQASPTADGELDPTG